MASRIESSIGADSGTLSMATLTKNLDRTMALFGQVLMAPVFREDRVKLAVNRMIEEIRRQNDDPKEVADRELRKALYAGHPLGRYPTIKTCEKREPGRPGRLPSPLLPSQQRYPGGLRRFQER